MNKKNKIIEIHVDKFSKEQMADIEYCRSVFSQYENNMEQNFDNEDVQNAYVLLQRIRILTKDKNPSVHQAALSAMAIYGNYLYGQTDTAIKWRLQSFNNNAEIVKMIYGKNEK